ncbi:hypothetical protein ACFC0M_24585 [Streptomyces sp. NPDC056149]|uniref:hypothetical protein n=1 Tax=Streptomyces sp. NPDC056149 TaxID=3345728 RepID=UPI0035E1CC31
MGTTTDKRSDDAKTTTTDQGAKDANEAAERAEETAAAGGEKNGEKAGEKAGETVVETAEAQADGGTEAGERAAGEADGADAAADADTDTDTDVEADAAEAPARSGAAAGAGAVVAAGLGLASMTGTWLGTLLAERQTLVGQIKVQSGKATDQIATVYGAPWHTTALVNGVFAVLAMVVAAVVLTGCRPTWVRAVAWGGLVLGFLGLLISAGMYLDLFASLPSLPKVPGAGS